eukprot:10841397-Alexandrium_andersonii.AAC.1
MRSATPWRFQPSSRRTGSGRPRFLERPSSKICCRKYQCRLHARGPGRRGARALPEVAHTRRVLRRPPFVDLRRDALAIWGGRRGAAKF